MVTQKSLRVTPGRSGSGKASGRVTGSSLYLAGVSPWNIITLHTMPCTSRQLRELGSAICVWRVRGCLCVYVPAIQCCGTLGEVAADLSLWDGLDAAALKYGLVQRGERLLVGGREDRKCKLLLWLAEAHRR